MEYKLTMSYDTESLQPDDDLYDTESTQLDDDLYDIESTQPYPYAIPLPFI